MTFLVSDDCLRLGLRAGAIVFRAITALGPDDIWALGQETTSQYLAVTVAVPVAVIMPLPSIDTVAPDGFALNRANSTR